MVLCYPVTTGGQRGSYQFCASESPYTNPVTRSANGLGITIDNIAFMCNSHIYSHHNSSAECTLIKRTGGGKEDHT